MTEIRQISGDSGESQTLLIAGATGKTGHRVVQQALALGHKVRVIVRSKAKLPADVLEHPQLTVIEASILELEQDQMSAAVKDCDAVISCLGHVMSFEGLFGDPRKLCTDATRRLCKAIEVNRPTKSVKFILMNTVGVANPELGEKRTWLERSVLTLLRWFLPPHSDNETAAEHLYSQVGQNNEFIEWCSVRPDALTEAEVSSYDINESPVTGIFSGRPTARANVAHFMTCLVDDKELWAKWRFRMPVIMNTVSALSERV